MATTTINLSSLDGTDGFRMDGKIHLGRSVSNAEDVNGDGFDDLIIGAPSVFSIPEDPFTPGSSYVLFGKGSGFDAVVNLSNLNGNNGFSLDGVSSAGISVSNAGDINGDGFDDVVVGDPYGYSNGYDSGSSYVVFGKDSGFDASLNLSALDGMNGFRLDGASGGFYGGDYSGASVSGAGDVNGDGFDDLIVGAFGADSNGMRDAGSTYVVFGKDSGFDATLNLSSVDGTNGFRLDGEAAYDRSGTSVSGAGDVNGDGFDDVIVSANGADPNGKETAGSSYIVFGKDSGFDASLNLSVLDGMNGFRLDGETEYDHSGFSVSNAGDVNGDGFDDLIVGAFGADSKDITNAGASYVVFGKGSGFEASLDLSSLNGNNGFRMDGVAKNDNLGSSVNTAGDVNGDGFDDLIIGVPGVTNSYFGSSYVVFGKASGFDATLDLSSLDSNNGILLDGVAVNFSSLSVSSAGDVNGDGFDDMIVGVPYGNYSSYVVFGRSDFGDGNVIEGTAGDDTLQGTSGADIFEALEGNDAMIGRGGADEFHGDAGNDHIKVADLSFGSVDGGIGSDVLHTDGKDLNLDLSFLADRIQGIETICLYGRGDNTLTLTAEGLINLSDTTNVLKIHGNAGDLVILEDEWVDQGSHGFYHTYTQDDAVLLVGQNMAIEFA